MSAGGQGKGLLSLVLLIAFCGECAPMLGI